MQSQNNNKTPLAKKPLRQNNSFINENHKQSLHPHQPNKESKVDSCINNYLQDRKKIVKSSSPFKGTPNSNSKANIDRINQSYDNRFDHVRSMQNKDECELN